MIKAVIQARMSSQRLRGKTLMPLAGKPLLRRVVDTAANTGIFDEICVVTSVEKADDPIEAYCNYIAIPCYRGSKDDVFQRYDMVAKEMDDNDHIVRITADNPFNNKPAVQRLLEKHTRENADYTHVSGLSHVVYEFIKISAFKLVVDKAIMLSQYDKEHVTPVFRSHPEIFKAQAVEPEVLQLKPQLDQLLTVDTADDLRRVEALIEALRTDVKGVNFTEIYSWLSRYTG